MILGTGRLCPSHLFTGAVYIAFRDRFRRLQDHRRRYMQYDNTVVVVRYRAMRARSYNLSNECSHRTPYYIIGRNELPVQLGELTKMIFY